MRFKSKVVLALGCVSLLALSIPAFGVPSPHGIAKQPKKTIAQHAPKVAPKNATKHASRPAARDERAPRLVSLPVAEEPKRPMFGWPKLVSEARKYMGTNPTARSRLWCATFMNMVLHKVGYAGTNSDAAKSFAQYGRRISEPQIGAIAVLTRGKRGGHVGVVTGIDSQGNPIIISGNHNKRVGESTYARSRVIAYVMPNDDRPGTTQIADRSAPNRSASEPGISSPIAELLAAIEVEQSRSERPNPQVGQPRPQSQPQAQPQPQPAEPRRIVQQLAEPAPAPVSTLSARRNLPLDPGLAEFLGLRDRAQERRPGRIQATPPPQHIAPQRQRQVQQPPRRVADLGGVFGPR
jgi:uncharacterized protein (TIGR02594 family)